MFQNWKAIVGVGSALLTLLPLSAQAGADGRKNTAIVLGAAAAYELLKGKTTEAIALGAGAAYAGKRYEDARKDESARNNGRYYYGNDYNRNTDPYYNSGYGNRNNTYNNAPYYNNNDQDYENYSGSSDRAQQFDAWRGTKRGSRAIGNGQYSRPYNRRGNNGSR